MLALLARSLGFCWYCTRSHVPVVGFACIFGRRESRVVTVVTGTYCLPVVDHSWVPSSRIQKYHLPLPYMQRCTEYVVVWFL